MKKINFKKGKYILPLIITPFVFVFFYVFQAWGANSKPTAAKLKADSLANVRTDYINTEIPGVSKDVEKGDIKDRFESLREAYKNDKDFSALSKLEEDEQRASGYTSAYSNEDIERIRTNQQFNKLSGSLNTNRANLDRNMQRMLSRANQSSAYSRSGNSGKTPEDIYNELQRQNMPYSPNESGYKEKDEMEIFREQMRVVDSMQKVSVRNANQNTNTKDKRNSYSKRFDPSGDTTFKPLPVTTTPKKISGFNTIRAFKASEAIRAIVDEAQKVTAGTRLRIRLLQEIVVGNNTIPEGTYIYGFVTGFQTQRVNITVNQIVYNGQPLPVKLDVFDTDGYLGIYVPESNFLEFTKQIGTQGTSGLSSIETSTESDLTASLLSKLFTTTSSSINKVIRKDKAFIKYNYNIYLKENSK